MILRIYNYLPPEIIDDDTEPPTHVDYTRATRVRLEPVYTKLHGDIIRIDYYGQGGERIVKEEHNYTPRQGSNLPLSRLITISWILQDGSDHPITKMRFKAYSQSDSLKAIARRRQNIVLWMRSAMLNTPLAGPAQQLLNDLSRQVNDYLLTGSGLLRSAVIAYGAADPQHWLNLPVDAANLPGLSFRHYIAAEIKYGEA